MINDKRKYNVAFLIPFFMTVSSQTMAGVLSVGAETVSGSDDVKQVSVKCSTKNDLMFLVKHIGDVQWCDQELRVVCGVKKVAVAQKVCGRKYFSLLKGSNANSPSEKLTKTSGEPAVSEVVLERTSDNRESLRREYP